MKRCEEELEIISISGVRNQVRAENCPVRNLCGSAVQFGHFSPPRRYFRQEYSVVGLSPPPPLPLPPPPPPPPQSVTADHTLTH